MRIVSLHQPWATLVALGEKKIETRGWSTDFRGRLAIHAAMARRKYDTYPPLIQAALERREVKELPLGAVVCIVSLEWIQPTEIVRGKLSADELAFGNYEDGRFAWGLRLLKVFDYPLHEKGHQRFWNWDERGHL